MSVKFIAVPFMGRKIYKVKKALAKKFSGKVLKAISLMDEGIAQVFLLLTPKG